VGEDFYLLLFYSPKIKFVNMEKKLYVWRVIRGDIYMGCGCGGGGTVSRPRPRPTRPKPSGPIPIPPK